MRARSSRLGGGSGEPLLLIHGIGSTWRVWKPVLDRLEASHEVLAVDVPGFGRSAPLPPGTRPTIEAMADALERALDAAGWDQPHIAGNSMGGWLALELGRRGRAASVVAISPAGMWTEKERVYSRNSLRFQHAAATRIAPYADTLTRTALGRTLVLGGVMSRPWRADPDDAADALRLFAGAPGLGRDARGDDERHAARARLDRVPGADRLGLARHAPAPAPGRPLRARDPGAELVRLPGLGHVPMGDDPDAVADSILEFTARHARERATA